MWGVIPAAGAGTRIQPLAFSKELLPVGTWHVNSSERPRAVSEYIVERMILGGVDKLCFVVAPGKSDILEYYGGRALAPDVCFVVQPRPVGLCDALFRAAPFIADDETLCIGLPDTVWFPEDALKALPDDVLSFLTFPSEHPDFFDSVLTDDSGHVIRIDVKRQDAVSKWIWGAFKMPARTFHQLRDLWRQRGGNDEYVGPLVNAYLENGGRARAVPAGESYIDVGTFDGYRHAVHILTPASEPKKTSYE